MTAETGSGAHGQRILNTQARYTPPAGAREIILVRHGSTDTSDPASITVDGLLHADPPLRPEGREQAEALAERLGSGRVTHIFITPLRRTRQTAAPLVARTGIDPVVIDELREVHMGDWEQEFHLRVSGNDPLLKRMLDEENWDVVPNTERMAAFAVRVRAGIGRVLDAVEPGCAAVVIIHGGTIGEICRQATGSRPFAFFGPENTSISRLVVHENGHWSLRSFNDVSHLG